MKPGLVAAVLAMGVAVGTVHAQAIPDSPRPNTLPDAVAVTPGKGAPSTSTPVDNNGGIVPGATLAPAAPRNEIAASDVAAPEIAPELGPGGRVQTIQTNVNFVQVPFTVKDKSGKLVPAVDWREVRIYENGLRKHISLFTSDPYPLSVAFVIDQSLPQDVMSRVNAALGAVQGAFTTYDEMAIFTYNNSTSMRTDYTGAQSARVGAVIAQSKTSGRDAYLASPMGPLSQTTNINGHQFDPNTAPVRNSNSSFVNQPKEQHTLNDAIFEAAKSLAKRPDTRRRMIYVVSDGKEFGSKVTYKDNVRIMQTNKISLYATVVGDSATPYIGFLSHYHIPFEMKNNLLPQYATATGGEAVSSFRQRDIETSFSRIAEDVRVQYTAGYYSNEPITDGKFRTVEVQVLRPDLDVIAKKGYYPTPENTMRNGRAGSGTTNASPR